MKDIERPKEPARKKAERRWANHDLRRRYKGTETDQRTGIGACKDNGRHRRKSIF